MKKYDVFLTGKVFDIYKKPFLHFSQCFKNVDGNQLDFFRLLIKHLDDRISVSLDYEEKKEIKKENEELEKRNSYLEEIINFYENMLEQYVRIVKYYQDKEC